LLALAARHARATIKLRRSAFSAFTCLSATLFDINFLALGVDPHAAWRLTNGRELNCAATPRAHGRRSPTPTALQ
jgi:hypothetical protein